MKTTLDQFLTPLEFVQARDMYLQNKTDFARRVCDEIIQPNIERINRALGQENDPLYLAYAIEYAMTEMERRS